MNGHRILRLIAVAGLAKLAIGSHRHRMGPQAHGHWQDRVLYKFCRRSQPLQL